MGSTSEWLHFHHHNNTTNNPSAGGQVAATQAATSASDLLFWSGPEATVVSTTAAANPPPGPAQSHTGPAQLGPEGRLGKPARRRTRASRRTPTTLLNTDTTNFRAMVQQFTGGPSSTAFSVLGGPNTFGVGPSRAQMVSGPGYGLQFPLAQQQPPLQFSNNNMQGMGELFTTTSSSTGNNGANVNGNTMMVGPVGTGGGSSSSENRSCSNTVGGFQF